MQRTLTLTLDRPFTAAQIEKLWDAEQSRRREAGQPTVACPSLTLPDPNRLSLECHAEHVSEDDLFACLSAAIRRDYPDCRLQREEAPAPRRPAGVVPAAAADKRLAS